jgi:hypothetical protein
MLYSVGEFTFNELANVTGIYYMMDILGKPMVDATVTKVG